MSNVLRLTVRFLSPIYHGRSDAGEPEWPPSPLRVFQALTAAFAPVGGSRAFDPKARRLLDWFQKATPEIVAPDGRVADRAYRLYVPNNAADLVAAAWKRGNAGASIAEHRTEKDVRPTHLSGEAVHYLYPLPPEGCPHEEVLKAAARSVTHLGWGVDMVAADAVVVSQKHADELPGHRWRVVQSGGVSLRVPKAGTLADLMQKHEAFLGRLSADGFKPVPPLSCFDVVQYHSATAGVGKPPERPMAAFEIHRTIDEQERNPGRSRFRPFHHVRRVATVAGMVRHAAADVADKMGHSQEWVKEHVCGHGDEKNGQATSNERLMFMPLPSLQPVVGVGGIRRVLVVGWPGCAILGDLRRRLNGMELIDKDSKQPVAVLSQLATSDKGVLPFTRPSRSWSTVTPVILPGYDDPDGLRRKYRDRVKAGLASAEEQRHLLERLDSRIVALLWKAFDHAGWTADALAEAQLEYREVGWFRGLDLAKRYELPKVNYPKYHVRVRFASPVRGPLAVGAGRYRGMGFFAADAEG